MLRNGRGWAVLLDCSLRRVTNLVSRRLVETSLDWSKLVATDAEASEPVATDADAGTT